MTFPYLADMARKVLHMATRNVWFMESQAAGSLTLDCFHEGPNFLAIDPDECIDCGVCVPECPVDAIFAEEDIPSGQEHMAELNAELSHLPD